MGVNYYLPPELEERKRKYLDIPQYEKTGGRNVGQGGPGSLDKLLAKRKREGEAFRHKHEAGVQQMRGDWMGIKPAHQQIEASKQAILEESIENLKDLIPPPSDRPPTKQQLMRQGMKNTQLERQQTIKDIAEYLNTHFAQIEMPGAGLDYNYLAYIYKEKPKKDGDKAWTRVHHKIYANAEGNQSKLESDVKWLKDKGYLKEATDLPVKPNGNTLQGSGLASL